MSQKAFMSASDIRRAFLDYFRQQQHEVAASSSLVPHNDPTLLFTNAGMVPFKDVFLGKETRSYQRATSSQRCVRAGGKHNDLENVGYTARHHTFFEMLGNFSFGDYFKREAIDFAWRFLTQVLQLPPERLWVTVFHEDQEAEDIWLKELKIDPNRFTRCGEKDNFWSMGPTGPCGSCTEIFYDHGPEVPGGPPGSPEADGDRYVEIWNLVFMQYDRAANGTMTPLPKPSVDTGMGLERIAAVMQGVHNNYDIDLFKPLIQVTADLAHTKDLQQVSLRVIADHIRSCAFLIADGITPSNEGRGYVLRRIIRRALRHGHQLGLSAPFFHKLVNPLAKEMGEAYPELLKPQKHIEKILHQEEEQFGLTLAQGIKLFEQILPTAVNNIIPGDAVFKLYDTYGFPVDLTADMARERQLAIDYDGFEVEMNKQRERSRQASRFEADYSTGANIETPTEFVGYKNLLIERSSDSGNILALYSDGNAVAELGPNDKGSVILDRTSFYAEGGGQVGDQGWLRTDQSEFRVADTRKQGKAHVHVGQIKKGKLKIGDRVYTEVDAKRRTATVLNHTATHLLHMVLHQLLGDSAIQKGSLVEPERLRFDFAYPTPLTAEQLNLIEQRVNEEIRSNHEAKVKVTHLEDAIKQGAVALFEEKYGDQVRMVQFGQSTELCGGTHAHHTGDIGLFKITSESGVAAGIRRIEAVTGAGALLWLENREKESNQKLQQTEERLRSLEKQLTQLKEKFSGSLSQDLADKAKDIQGVKVLAMKVDGIDAKSLRNTVDQLKNKLGHAVVILAVVQDHKVSVIGGVTKNLSEKIKANELVNSVAIQIGGKGGGRADLAEAGGNQPEHLEKALQSVYLLIEDQVKLL